MSLVHPTTLTPPGQFLDIHPDDPWDWTRVVYRIPAELPDFCVGSDGTIMQRDQFGLWVPRELRKATSFGYLCFSHKGTTYLMHRFVLETFVGLHPYRMFACHVNGNPCDNRLGNLRWGTHQENMAEKRGSKITLTDAKEIRRLSATGVSQRKLASQYSIARVTVREILDHKIWTRPDPFEFKFP